ncbi:Putative NIN-like transcription factor [Ectocarpus siliculosus]|uniref:NIN-like transcription factor n=1 Tax=Ectocarpus siliculosus TaxID=2880 RepID=D7FS12_ECTSI|nr:Putative NIN-like transcription factor [Ectocarpus siliculosus]|eukprot:CBJ30953.1 Putative NIN-like transcription factor [Ectocarpus siliculosus]
MAQPSGGLQDSRSQAPSLASSSRLQRGIPSFKLSDDELARSKRFRNRVPSDGSRDGAGSHEGGGPTPTTTLEGIPAPGPRSVSSFTLASDVFRMSHNSSWGSGTGSNFFGFGLPSVDGEGEDAVQRFDDATFNDLNFFTMEGIGPSDLPETAPRETSGPGLDTKPTDTRSSTDGGGPDRYSIERGGTHGGPRSDPLQPAVAKEEMVVPAIVDGTGSASNILRRASSARDVLRSASMSGRDSNRDFLEGNVFDLEGGLPTFSTAMEEYLNRQLEAAEHSLDDPAGDERAFGCMAGARDGGAGVGGTGGTGAEGHLGVAGRVGASPIEHPTRSVVVKQECRRSRGASDGVLQGTTHSQCTQEEGGGLETKAAERRTRCKRGTQQQKQKRSKHETKSESDEYADSSQSEYEPPTCTPREGKAKKGRGRRRGAAATTATRAAKTSSGSSGVRTASVSSAFLRRGGSLKRQTSEDVAARLPLEVLECFYHVPLNVAAQQLNVSLTMLKKLCRAYGVKRWPHRQVSSLDKTTSKLEDKIKTRRDGGKDAPSLVRKLTQARKRRKVIIKTASAGLDASVLNSIFTCRPGDIDEDMLLSSTDVAKAVEKVQFRQDADHKGSGAESDSAAGDNSDSNSDSDDDDDVESYGPRAKPPSPPPPAAAKKTTRIRAVFAATPAFCSKPPAVAKSVASPPPAFEPGGRSKSAATPRPGVEPGNKTAGNKPTSGSLGSGGKLCMKAGRPAEAAKKTKGDAPMTAKGRKGVTAAAAGTAANHRRLRTDYGWSLFFIHRGFLKRIAWSAAWVNRTSERIRGAGGFAADTSERKANVRLYMYV